MTEWALLDSLIFKGFPVWQGGLFVIAAIEYHSCAWEVLALEVFKRVARSSLMGFPFFLLLSLHNLLYTFLYT
jgi:hypothetical protein